MSRWFRVATEGATTDGRSISRQWIEQMAKNFNPSTYGARVWLEHMRGMFHDGPYAALGDVTAIKAEEVEGGKLGLFAQIDPTDRLKQIIEARQKIYSSIEVDADFAGSGEAYLVGLAVTDSPASLGTDMLQFSSQQGERSPLASRKQRPENLFTAAIETEFDFSDASNDAEPGESMLAKFRALFRKHDAHQAGKLQAFHAELEQTLTLFAERHQALAEDVATRPTAEAFAALQAAQQQTHAQLEQLHSQLDNTPDTPHRAPATGGSVELTDF